MGRERTHLLEGTVVEEEGEPFAGGERRDRAEGENVAVQGQRHLSAGVAGAAALGLVSAGSAAADTSVATANAVTVGVLGV